MDACSSLRLLREAIDARLRETIDPRAPASYRPILLRHILRFIAHVAQPGGPHCRAEDYPPDVVEALSQLFADEIRTFRTITADLTAHYLAQGCTAEEAHRLVTERHLEPDSLC